jgi:hypothetical protein
MQRFGDGHQEADSLAKNKYQHHQWHRNTRPPITVAIMKLGPVFTFMLNYLLSDSAILPGVLR